MPYRTVVGSLLSFFFSAPRAVKRLIEIALDVVLIPLAILGAWLLRSSSQMHLDLNDPAVWATLAGTVIGTVIVFARIGLYRAVLRYLSSKVWLTVAVGVLCSALMLGFFSFITRTPMPRSVPIIYALVALLLIGSSRFLIRAIVHAHSRPIRESVVIYGAGAAGSQLATALSVGREYMPVAFVDDDPSLLHAEVQGLTVYPPSAMAELIKRYQVDRVLLAVPSLSKAQRHRILLTLEQFPVQVQTIAGMADLVSGKARIQELHDIEIDDLLGRDPVKPIEGLMARCITGRVVMVTGAGGSIGSELCRQIMACAPKELVLFERNEFALYNIEQELRKWCEKCSCPTIVHAMLGDVQERSLVGRVMKRFHVQTVYHAAAYKHVPIVELNMVQGVRNNVLGTWHTAQAAIECGVETFVLISTDKAVRSTNVMGASKRMAELCLQALADSQKKTRICMVRFGNVLGSSGSVVPLFNEQIRKGGPVTVTHPDVIRYFMTIPEAAQLVIQAGAMSKGGDVFLLDMGEPVQIAELAKRMIRLMGLTVQDDVNPDGDIAIQYTGLRPGEKLFEELLIGDNVSGTEHARIMRAEEKMLPYAELVGVLKQLELACATGDCDSLRRILLEMPTDYQPQQGIRDEVWLEEEHHPSIPDSKVVSLH
ncbi:polysaccharide biosynthesis protein [Permianibacter sp. IMCC34836]|uniref:nucleoside-diphosphate sugar epimerase/dehydratase n=1 Tax=Permianibacter fluminis TaxID=2738515 RepID=UPI0015528F48|nr:nucleoside-diphosphate sugar epimerase/dehydratase [Permianibacter fluminis]NQD37420.1 polysaccharide biosynthesis protein [Permianibacter fluminis]